MAELTEVMRQRGDIRLIEMLSKIRVGDVDDAVEYLLKSRIDVQKQISDPIDTLHLLAENAPADAQNKLMINQFDLECILINAIDKFPTNLVFSDSDYELKKIQSLVLLVI